MGLDFIERVLLLDCWSLGIGRCLDSLQRSLLVLVGHGSKNVK